MNSMKRKKDMTLNNEPHRSVSIQYATGKERRNRSRKNKEAGPKQKQCPAVFVSGGESKFWCCKEQYYTGTWNSRSMNQGKLDVVKQETARVNVDTLGISEFKWTETGKFNSDDCYIYYCGQESLRRNGVALWVNKRVWNAVISSQLQSQNNRMISVHFQDKPFNITVTQVYSLTTNAKEAEVELFYEDLQLLLELKWKKDVLFYHRELECNSRKSRDTWSNRKVWPWNTEWSRAKAKIFCHENTLVTADTLFQNRTDNSTHECPQMIKTKIKLIVFVAAENGESSLQSEKQNLELTVPQNMNCILQNSGLNWRKWGKPLDHSGVCVCVCVCVF